MPTTSETADRLTRRRARMLLVLGIFFIAQQATFFVHVNQPINTPGYFRIVAWLVMSCALLLVLATGGSHFRSAEVRALMNDEVTLANRADAIQTGYWAAMLACIILYALSLFEPFAALKAVHVVMTAGIGAAILRFGRLEMRAMRD
jgi:uncharacterized membrane protein YhdT